MDAKSLFYETFAERFDPEMNHYDLQRRLEIVYDELLPDDLAGKQLLDAGCGTGWFSKKACDRGAKVTSLDVGEKLLAQVAKKCDSRRVVGDVLALPFDPA
jgi:malonyl-CoA O-methyltransferase